MSALIDSIRACVLTIAVLGTVAVGSASLALWQADAAQPEARMWIRDGGQGCRHVPVSEAIGARPCQS